MVAINPGKHRKARCLGNRGRSVPTSWMGHKRIAKMALFAVCWAERLRFRTRLCRRIARSTTCIPAASTAPEPPTPRQ